MKVTLISKITLSTLATAVASLIIAPSASAFSFSLDGTFDDGGTLGGIFNYDEVTEAYSNLNINTTGGSLLSESTYTDDGSFFGDSPTGLIILDDNTGDISLTLDFVSSLSSLSGEISLDTATTQEEDFFGGNTRLLSSGTVSPVAVPFKPSANLAIFIILGLMGLNHYRKR